MSQIPPRSALFRLVPHGLGTSQVESLTSYVSRLAKAHLVTPSAMLHRGLVWWDQGQPERVGEWKRRPGRLLLRRSINAHLAGEPWVDLLERLTRLTGLAGCTMQGWASCFPQRGLLRHHLAWCPECLAQDPDPYDRLAWCLPPLKVCSVHRRRLCERCPHCGSAVPVIHARSVPGVCPHCTGSLNFQVDASRLADEDEMRTALLIASFFETAGREPNFERRRVPANVALRRCMSVVGINDAASLAKLLNVSRITAWYWLQGRSVPSLGHTLNICNCFGLSVVEFLIGGEPMVSRPRHMGELALQHRRRAPRIFDEVAAERQIRAYCDRHKQRPPSMVEVAAGLGFELRVLRRHFPQLCREISRRHRGFLNAELHKRREQLRAECRTAIDRARNLRGRPKRCEVVKFLPRPGVLRSAAARAVLDQMLLDLPDVQQTNPNET